MGGVGRSVERWGGKRGRGADARDEKESAVRKIIGRRGADGAGPAEASAAAWRPRSKSSRARRNGGPRRRDGARARPVRAVSTVAKPAGSLKDLAVPPTTVSTSPRRNQNRWAGGGGGRHAQRLERNLHRRRSMCSERLTPRRLSSRRRARAVVPDDSQPRRAFPPSALFQPRRPESRARAKIVYWDHVGSEAKKIFARATNRRSSRAEQTETPTAVAACARASLLHLSPWRSPRARHHLPRDGWTTTTTARCSYSSSPPAPAPAPAPPAPRRLHSSATRFASASDSAVGVSSPSPDNDATTSA